ncbi:hypothetical protein GCM10028833_34690 [Glycomyces tarimensis]
MALDLVDAEDVVFVFADPQGLAGAEGVRAHHLELLILIWVVGLSLPQRQASATEVGREGSGGTEPE